MAERIYNLERAKSSLSHLVERAAAGEEIIIAKAGRPKAKLVPVSRSAHPRRAGGWKGKMSIAPDFDAPLPDDVQATFSGRK